MSATHHLGGWKVTALSKTYAKVRLHSIFRLDPFTDPLSQIAKTDPLSQIAKATGLINRLEFRRKFESIHEPMFVCYPEDGFGLDGVMALLKALRK